MAVAPQASARLKGNDQDTSLEEFSRSTLNRTGVSAVGSAPVTTALILAAGQGSRLNHGPKPLHPLLGVPLLARSLNTLEQAGIRRAYVVIGFEAERVRRGIEQDDSIGIEIVWLTNDEWGQPNGLSVLAARDAIEEPFVLVMADHVFDPEIVSRLIETPRAPDEVLLAVDRRLENIADLDDATKVRVAAGHIEQISKSLVSYNAVDTGLFVAGPSLFAAVHQACIDDRKTLSAGVQMLAEEGKATVVDVSGMMWHDVDTPADVARAERKLLQFVRKQTDGPISRYLNRPLSTALSRLVVKHTNLTPGHFTLVHLVVGLASGFVTALGGYVAFLLGAILFQAASVLDGCDGEIAKLKFQTSARGEWLDTAADGATFLACLVGLTIGVYRSDLAPVFFYFGVAGLGIAVIIFCNLYAHLIRSRGQGSLLAVRYGYETGDGWFKRFLRFAHYLGKRDFIAAFVLLLAVVGQLQVLLIVFGVLAGFLLLPASIKVNLGSWRLSRRVSQRVSGAARAEKRGIRFPAPQLAAEAAVVRDRSHPTDLSERR
jgi:choline kinase/phosphatidylglycerophosphate synthase